MAKNENIGKIDHYQIQARVFDSLNDANRVTVVGGQFAIELNKNEDSIQTWSSHSSLSFTASEAGSVSQELNVEGQKTVKTYTNLSNDHYIVQVSPLASGDVWFTQEGSLLCASRLRLKLLQAQEAPSTIYAVVQS